jgi:1-acyl-sn-glycerol-3-phosphate acyltransferase
MARTMIEKFIPTLPFASYLFSRWGQITGTPENCRRLLEDEEAILVFPEGAKGISKPFTQRYQLQEFGSGFMRLALETNAPIVPVAVVGAEEQAPAVNLKPLAKILGAPAFPVMPLPPFFPILPYPTKYRIYFGEPLRFEGDPDEDDEVIAEKVVIVRNHIQSMLRVGLKERRHVFW